MKIKGRDVAGFGLGLVTGGLPGAVVKKLTRADDSLLARSVIGISFHVVAVAGALFTGGVSLTSIPAYWLTTHREPKQQQQVQASVHQAAQDRYSSTGG